MKCSECLKDFPVNDIATHICIPHKKMDEIKIIKIRVIKDGMLFYNHRGEPKVIKIGDQFNAVKGLNVFHILSWQDCSLSMNTRNDKFFETIE